jgi:hypothetical protein
LWWFNILNAPQQSCGVLYFGKFDEIKWKIPPVLDFSASGPQKIQSKFSQLRKFFSSDLTLDLGQGNIF